MRSAIRTVEKRLADEQGGAAAGQLLKALVHLVLSLHVERRGRLVQHQERAIAHEGPRQGQLLPLAAGQLTTAELTAKLCRQAVRERRDHGIGAGFRGRSVQPGRVVPRLDLSQADVLPGGQLVAHEVLEDHSHPPAQLGRVELPQVNAVEQDAPLRRVVEAEQQLDERGLAGAIAAHQRHRLVPPEMQRDIVQHRLGLAGVGERDLLEGDAGPDRRRHGPRRGGDRQVGRRFEHAKEAGEVPEHQRQEAKVVANRGEALLEHGGCAAVQHQVARRPLTRSD